MDGKRARLFNSFRPVRFQPQLALPFLLLSGGDNRSAKGGISYVSAGLALMEL